MTGKIRDEKTGHQRDPSTFRMRVCFVLSLAFPNMILTAGCRRNIADVPVGPVIAIQTPLGLPPVPIPASNPPTIATIALGRKLFYDTRLSRGDVLACASCHKPEFDFTDGLALSKGASEAIGLRNAPTIENAAYLPMQFWDGRAISLEEQAESPIADPLEMNQPHKVSVSKLSANADYRAMFQAAFGSPDVTLARIEKALASFERTILSGNSAFDRYQYGGDHKALSLSAIRGLQIFIDPHKGNCAACHVIGKNYALFTDGKFHNIGEGVKDDGSFQDVGRYHETRIATDQGAFMTPTLRNIAHTAPYMHDGRLKTLRDVVDFYAGGGNSNPYLDPQIRNIVLTGGDRDDLVIFLNSLTGELLPNVEPPGKQ